MNKSLSTGELMYINALEKKIISIIFLSIIHINIQITCNSYNKMVLSIISKLDGSMIYIMLKKTISNIKTISLGKEYVLSHCSN